LRYNPANLLLDPYARATIVGEVRCRPEVLGHAIENPCAPSRLDSAAHVPRSIVLADMALAVSRPGRALADTILDEVHMRGFTATHPGVPPALRGTCAGLARSAVMVSWPSRTVTSGP